MSLILLSAYLCLRGAFSTQKLIEPRIEVLQTARVTLALISADLRGACSLPGTFEFLGSQHTLGSAEADDLIFATHNYTPRRPNEGDFCEVSYYLEQNEESGEITLWRRRNPTLAPNSMAGGRREELARGVQGLRFEYSDGLDWYDTWGEIRGSARQENSLRYRPNASGLPDAVRITLWLSPPAKMKQPAEQGSVTNEPPLAFQTVARLNLTPSSRASSSSSSATGSSSGSSSTPTPDGGPNQ
jgi:hypothetical protein